MRAVLDEAAAVLTDGIADARRLAWHRLSYQHTQAVLAAASEHRSPSTVNLIRAAMRGALKSAWRLGLMTAEEYLRASDLPRARGKSIAQGRALELAELRALLEVCKLDRTAAGARDAAFLALGYGCGLRQAELIGLDLEDFDQSDNSLLVHGKGKKERRAYIPEGALDALWYWLEVRDVDPGPLWHPITKGGGRILARRRLNSTNAAWWICRKRAEQAGVRPFSPHDLRRSYITHLWDAGADASTIAELAGHASIETTRSYDRRGDESRKKTVELIHVPYGASPSACEGEVQTPEITETAEATV